MSRYLKRLAGIEIELAGIDAPGFEYWLVADLEGIDGDLTCCDWMRAEGMTEEIDDVTEVTIRAGHLSAYQEFGVCEAHWP